jgi:hypothetical protein
MERVPGFVFYAIELEKVGQKRVGNKCSEGTTMKVLKLKPIAYALAVGSFVALTANCQMNTATVNGTVTDPSHAAVPKAQIEITNERTGVAATSASNGDGRYTFTFVLPGTYDLSVKATGFQTSEQKGVILQAGQTLELDFDLKVGAITQSLTVSGQAPLIQNSTSNQLHSVTNLEVQELPQPKLDWTTLMNFGTGLTNIGSGIGGVGTIMMNGLSPTSMSITVDGTNASSDPEEPAFGFYQQPNIINTLNNDAISEVSIVKGIIPASVGATVSGNVNLITKSGTNQFHGDLFEVNDVSAYDARNQFLSTKPRSTFNQYGGALGGPILKDKLFFFGSYEGARLSQFVHVTGNSPTPYLSSILPPVYADNFQHYPSVPQPAGNPTAITAPFDGTGALKNTDYNTAERGDYFISPGNQLTIRYTRSAPFKLIPNYVAVNNRQFVSSDDMINVNYVHTTGSLTSSTRFGYNKLYMARIDLGYNVGLQQVSFSGINNGGAEKYELKGGTYTYLEDVTVGHGRHLFQFGGIVQRQNSSRLDLNTASFSYSSLADLLANVPSSTSLTFAVPTSILHNYQFGGYMQDDYKATSNLTLNLGVRYDVFTVPKERDGRLFNRGVDPNRPYLGYGFGPYRPPSSIYNGDFNNVQPRVGFAWSPGSSNRTVVRGGFGVFVGPRPFYAGIATEMQAGPNIPFRSTTNRGTNLAAGLNYPIPEDDFIPTLQSLVSRGFLSPEVASFSPIATNFPDPYSMQWMIGVERELGFGTTLSVDYVGNRGLKMNMNYYQNLPDRLTGIAPDPTFARFILMDATDSSSYNSLQVSFKKRFSHGLAFSVNYTYSKNVAYCLGDATNWGTCIPQDSTNLRADLGPTNFDLRNNFSQTLIYQIPFSGWLGLNGPAARALIGGWQLSETLTDRSGFPLNITEGNSTYPDSRPDVVPNVNPINSNYRSTLGYLNPAAFSIIPIISASGASARPGNLGRNSLRLPTFWNVDMSAAKAFKITEKVQLQLRGDFLNAFNHTNLSGLVTDTNNGTFGTFRSATARTIQIGARLQF